MTRLHIGGSLVIFVGHKPVYTFSLCPIPSAVSV